MFILKLDFHFHIIIEFVKYCLDRSSTKRTIEISIQFVNVYLLAKWKLNSSLWD